VEYAVLEKLLAVQAPLSVESVANFAVAAESTAKTSLKWDSFSFKFVGSLWEYS